MRLENLNVMNEHIYKVDIFGNLKRISIDLKGDLELRIPSDETLSDINISLMLYSMTHLCIFAILHVFLSRNVVNCYRSNFFVVLRDGISYMLLQFLLGAHDVLKQHSHYATALRSLIGNQLTISFVLLFVSLETYFLFMCDDHWIDRVGHVISRSRTSNNTDVDAKLKPNDIHQLLPDHKENSMVTKEVTMVSEDFTDNNLVATDVKLETQAVQQHRPILLRQ